MSVPSSSQVWGLSLQPSRGFTGWKVDTYFLWVLGRWSVLFSVSSVASPGQALPRTGGAYWLLYIPQRTGYRATPQEWFIVRLLRHNLRSDKRRYGFCQTIPQRECENVTFQHRHENMFSMWRLCEWESEIVRVRHWESEIVWECESDFWA